MKRFIETEFFFLVKNTSQTGFDTLILEKEYESFASLLFDENDETDNKTRLFNTLCYTQVEFKSLLSKKKCPVGSGVYRKSAFAY